MYTRAEPDSVQADDDDDDIPDGGGTEFGESANWVPDLYNTYLYMCVCVIHFSVVRPIWGAFIGKRRPCKFVYTDGHGS